MTSSKAFAWVFVLYAVAGIGAALVWMKPKFLHGDSKRAETSAKTTEALVAVDDHRGAVAAASVVKIAEANGMAPESPSRSFIAQEVQIAEANLPAPDSKALLEAEKRRSAVMEGRLQEASGLYDKALKRSDQLEKERSLALAAKRASDDALEQVAAERLGAEKVKDRAIIVAVALGLLYLYTKFTHVGSGAMAEAVHDIKKGVPAIQALDGATTRFQQMIVRTINRFKEPPALSKPTIQ